MLLTYCTVHFALGLHVCMQVKIVFHFAYIYTGTYSRLHILGYQTAVGWVRVLFEIMMHHFTQ